MKNYFIAYGFTGESITELEKRISVAELGLATHGIKGYANLSEEDEFVRNKFTAAQIMEHAFQKIAAMDGLFALIHTGNKSEGLLMEVGYAIALKKPVVVAYQQDVSTYVPQLANVSIAYKDLDDLELKIKEAQL